MNYNCLSCNGRDVMSNDPEGTHLDPGVVFGLPEAIVSHVAPQPGPGDGLIICAHEAAWPLASTFAPVTVMQKDHIIEPANGENSGEQKDKEKTVNDGFN